MSRKKELTYMDLCGVPDCQHCDKVSCMWNAGYEKWRREVLIPRVEAARVAKGLNSPLSSLSCPVIDGRPLLWSVGKYFGKHRRVIAWFSEEHEARDYVQRCVLDTPGFKYDLLRSLF